MPADLTTLAKVKAFLGITDTSKDALLSMMITQVSSFISTACGGRLFKEATYTNELYDAPDGDKLFLRNYPVASISSLQYRTGTIASPTWFSYTANDYLLYDGEGYIQFLQTLKGIGEPYLSIRATYVAGYKIDFANETNPAVHTLPFDLTMIATQLAVSVYNSRSSSGVKAESTEGQSITYADVSTDMLTTEQEKIIARFTKYHV